MPTSGPNKNPRDRVRLKVLDPARPDSGGVTLDTWESYTFENDLFTPADSFSFRLGLTRPTGRRLTAEYLVHPQWPDVQFFLWHRAMLETPDSYARAAIGLLLAEMESGS